MSVVSNYTLVVEAVDDRLRIRAVNPSIEFGGAKEPLAAPVVDQEMTQLLGLTADYVVTKTGDYVGLSDLPAFRKAMQQILDGWGTKSGNDKARATMQEVLLSETFLNAQASQQWHAMIGVWNGAEMKLGEPVTDVSEETFPLFGGQHVVMNTTFLASHWVDCRRGNVVRRCVQLEARTIPDAPALQRVLRDFMARLGEKGELPPFEAFDVETRIKLVAEPDTLIPHSCTLSKNVRIVIRDSGKPISAEQLDTTEILFSYWG